MKKLSVFSLIVGLLFVFSCEDKVEKDTTPPDLTIVSPTSGSTVGEIVQIKVETTDKSGILKVDFYIQNSIVLSDTTLPYEYEWNTTTNQDGEYKVKVVSFDTKENFVESEFSVTVDNESKKPSPLDITSVEYDLEKMTVKWNQSQDSDFKQYNLYYSLSESGTKSLIQTFTDKSKTSYDTTTFDPTKENWFFLEVMDTYGLTKMGNGETNKIDPPPEKPELDTIIYDYDLVQFNIKWKKNNDSDFEKYRLYISDNEDMNNKTEIMLSDDQSKTTFSHNLDPWLIRYLQLEVYDIWGSKSISDVKKGDSNLWFNTTFGGPNDDFVNDMIQTSDGGFVIIGSTESFGNGKTDLSDLWLIKVDSKGNKLWDQTYGGDKKEVGYSIEETLDGGFIICGSKNVSEEFGNGYSDMSNIWLIKTDSDGNMVWNKTFGDSKEDVGYSVTTTNDGGYILTGYSNPSDSFTKNVFVLKTDNLGNQIWFNNYHTGDGGGKGKKIINNNGDYTVFGNERSQFGNETFLGLKINNEGDLIWKETYGDGILLDGSLVSGVGYVICGYHENSNSTVLKIISDDGDMVTGWDYSGSVYDIPESISFVNNEYITIGYDQSNSLDIKLSKYDQSLSLTYSRSFGGLGSDYGKSSFLIGDGGTVIVGGTGISGKRREIWLFKTNPDYKIPD